MKSNNNNTNNRRLNGKLFSGKFLTYVPGRKPKRGSIMQMELKVEGNRIHYSYSEIRKQH
jgi:hypothetical protein